ncbi:MAG TPA: hypothetical protein VKR43_14635 [Bryobacteraceae bacterium]|nr:hypothetical protein [Bryobacteraceae bacterium]
MKPSLFVAGALASALVSMGTAAYAHRLDEYLQATTISVERDRVQAQIRLTPGVAVFPAVLASIDTNADHVVSEPEQRAYAESVLRDLSFTVDGSRLHPRLAATKFPKIEEMKEGLGEVQIDFYADLPRGSSHRKLVFENHHQSQIAAYLVNCLVPRDPELRIVAQHRNYSQSVYQLDYVQTGTGAGGWWLVAAALVLLARFTLLFRQRAGTSGPTRSRSRLCVWPAKSIASTLNRARQ